ncbi:MAG: hypothetical protein ABR583_02585 [Gaiellaceae bacterium]
MINKRNAMLGWTVWQVGKRVAKRKARSAVPGIGDAEGGRVRRVLPALLIAVGALFVWHRFRGGGDGDEHELLD